MRVLFTRGCLAGLVVVAGGCSWLNDDEGWFVDRRDDYLEATQLPPLTVPEDLSVGDLSDPFPIPSVPTQTNPRYYASKPPLPDAIYANDTRREVRIQRLEERRWLVIPEPPTTVWPKIKQFLAENGVQVEYELPRAGRLDTEWLEVEPAGARQYRDVVRLVLQDTKGGASLTTGRDRLRLRLEQGMQAHTSEVHVRHENDSLALPSAPDLEDLNVLESAAPETEDEILRELGAYIAARVSEQTVSKVATNIAGTQKSRLDRNSAGQPVLLFNLDFDRAWAALGRALETGEVEVRDLNRESGVYYVTVTEQLFTGEEGPGFFRSLFTFGGDDPDELELRLVGSGRNYELSVHEENGGPADLDLAQELLILIREYAG